MRVVSNFDDYEIIDTSNGEKLERWGKNTVVIRPDPQIIWNTPRENPMWGKADGHYIRSNKGGGEWKFKKPVENQIISYKNLKFNVRPTGFKHMGIFPEQAVNWDYFDEIIRAQSRKISVLNLFAYTGGATLACAAAGAEVCHVDASKGMVAWARENAQASGLSDKPIRWIVDDCEKFVAREIKRGKRYDAIIMDPPSYGRGPNGEVWQLEEKIYNLVSLCTEALSENPLFFVLNSYTTGLPPSVMEYLLGVTVAKARKGSVRSGEIGLPVTQTGYNLPCGSTAIFETNQK